MKIRAATTGVTNNRETETRRDETSRPPDAILRQENPFPEVGPAPRAGGAGRGGAGPGAGAVRRREAT